MGSTNLIVSMGPRIVEMRFTWDHPFIRYAWREDFSNFHMYLDIKQMGGRVVKIFEGINFRGFCRSQNFRGSNFLVFFYREN